MDIAANTTTTATLDGDPTDGMGTFTGQLETVGDHDWIKVDLSATHTYRIYLSFLNTGSATEGTSFFQVLDSTGTPLLGQFDAGSGVGANSFLELTPGANGIFFIDVSDDISNKIGEYNIVVVDQTVQVEHQLSTGIDNVLGAGNDRIIGGAGADTINLGTGLDALGEQGNDIIIGNSLGNFISGGLGNDTIQCGTGSDVVFGDAGDDVIFGGIGNESIRGGSGNDIIVGGDDNDFIIGGTGKDFLTGGTGGLFNFDTFDFRTLADSLRGAGRDLITDFEEGTGELIQIDFDAKKGVAGIQSFKFIGAQHFHHKSGELHYVVKDLAGTTNDKTIVEGDVNGDGKADFQIELSGLHVLHAGDFSL